MKNRKGGFIKLIIIIIGAFLLLRYFDITISEINDWIKSLSLSKIIDWFKDLFN